MIITQGTNPTPKIQDSTSRCQPQEESIPSLLPQASKQQIPPHTHSCLPPAFAAGAQRELHLLAGLSRRQKVPVRSLFSKELLRGQRGPYLHAPSRAVMQPGSGSSQLTRGVSSHGRGEVALSVGKATPGLGHVEQLCAELFILHHLPGERRRKRAPESCL